jgi:hypothetical protein
MKKKNYYLKFPNLELKFIPGIHASSFPEHIFPRIEGKDKDGKDCIFIDCSNLFLAEQK